MIDAAGLFHVLILFIVVGLIAWLLWWLIDYIGLPEPFSKIARVIVAVVVVIFLINVLLGLSGTHLFR